MFVLQSCKEILPIEIQSIDEVRLLSFDAEKLVIGVTTTIKNPNSFKIIFDSLNLPFYINTDKMNSTSLEKPIEIKGGSSVSHQIKVN